MWGLELRRRYSDILKVKIYNLAFSEHKEKDRHWSRCQDSGLRYVSLMQLSDTGNVGSALVPANTFLDPFLLL